MTILLLLSTNTAKTCNMDQHLCSDNEVIGIKLLCWRWLRYCPSDGHWHITDHSQLRKSWRKPSRSKCVYHQLTTTSITPLSQQSVCTSSRSLCNMSCINNETNMSCIFYKVTAAFTTTQGIDNAKIVRSCLTPWSFYLSWLNENINLVTRGSAEVKWKCCFSQ